MPTTLLVFHRDDLAGLARLLAAFDGHVDETVIIDSSTRDAWPAVDRHASSGATRVRRVLPLSCTEPFRPYAAAMVGNARSIILDTDELPSPEFLAMLPSLGGAAAYRVHRFEIALEAYQSPIRIHEPGKVAWRGEIHEAPEVDGPVAEIPLPARILHHADYRGYLGARRAGYVTIDTLERPLTVDRLVREMGPRWRQPGRAALDPPGRLWMLLLAVRLRMSRFDPLNRRRGNLRTGRYLAAYLTARRNAFAALPPEDRRTILEMDAAIGAAGGVTRFLGFDDASYVDRLTATFGWNSPGAAVLEHLLRERYRTGRPVPTLEGWGAIGPDRPLSPGN